jgi:23S rRNA pseudouridine1911/1915/1917 synthase
MPRLTLPAGATPARLDKFLCDHLPGCSRRQAKQAIDAGLVRIDGRRASKGQEVAPGSYVDVDESLEQPQCLQPNPGLDITVVYEDAFILAIDKPAGMPSQALRADETQTVANFLVARDAAMAGVGRPLEAGLVHRLDNDTSGLLLAARTDAAYDSLRRQFARHQIDKKYLALVRGDLDEAATVDAPLAPASAGGRRMRLASPGEGRDAVTTAIPLRRWGSHTLVEVEIRTGVRHQVRVHLAGIGHPVAGDRLYDREADPSIRRHLLHASAIRFSHPDTGETVSLRSELPEDFRNHLTLLG